MHAIHTTPGFIVGTRPYSDAGRILTIFTRDFGLIYATAQGIRLEKSKLRYYTQEYSFGTYSLVRGKEFWRVTSATTNIEQLKDFLSADRSEMIERFDTSTIKLFENGKQELIARIALLLKRLLQGEDPHPELFDIVIGCRRFLMNFQGDLISESEKSIVPLITIQDNTIQIPKESDGALSKAHEKLNENEMQTLESLVVARIMFALGYIGEVGGLTDQLKSAEITPELLRSLNGQRTTLNQHINKALKESML